MNITKDQVKDKRLMEITERLAKNLSQREISNLQNNIISEKETENMAKKRNTKARKRGGEAKEDSEKKRTRNESDQENDCEQNNDEMEETASTVSESQQNDEVDDLVIPHTSKNNNSDQYKRERYVIKNGNLVQEKDVERGSEEDIDTKRRFPSNYKGEIIVTAMLSAEKCKIRGVNNLVKIVDKVSTANEMLDAQCRESSRVKDITFKIAINKYKKKGVISGWDLPIERLWDAIDDKEKIESIERMWRASR
ncbi:hypothetical protein PV325_014045 [Microctonus aethiopoides]|nr:hypothetical protein PV325_014045 [Microctonus aethiopoides]